MIATDNDAQLVTKIVNLYFDGTYRGNIDQLKSAFHSEAHITGSLNGQIYDWTLVDFMARVTAIPTSESKGEKYDKEIIFMDITHNAAMVKARVVVDSLIFTDYITLLKINGQWLIRNKSFTD